MVRSAGRTLALDERVCFGFVTPGPLSCVANGYVMRVDEGDEFVLSIDRANPAFHTFVGSLGNASDSLDGRESQPSEVKVTFCFLVRVEQLSD